MCERCTSGQQCISQLPRHILWDRMIWTFTFLLDLRARSSVADVWTGKSLEPQAQVAAYPQVVFPSLLLVVPFSSFLWRVRALRWCPSHLEKNMYSSLLHPKRQIAKATLQCCALQPMLLHRPSPPIPRSVIRNVSLLSSQFWLNCGQFSAVLI